MGAGLAAYMMARYLPNRAALFGGQAARRRPAASHQSYFTILLGFTQPNVFLWKTEAFNQAVVALSSCIHFFASSQLSQRATSVALALGHASLSSLMIFSRPDDYRHSSGRCKRAGCGLCEDGALCD